MFLENRQTARTKLLLRGAFHKFLRWRFLNQCHRDGTKLGSVPIFFSHLATIAPNSKIITKASILRYYSGNASMSRNFILKSSARLIFYLLSFLRGLIQMVNYSRIFNTSILNYCPSWCFAGNFVRIGSEDSAEI